MDNYSRAIQFCVENGIVLEEYEVDQLKCLYEGANIELIKTFNRAKKEYDDYSKKANEAIRKFDYKTAKKYVREMEDKVSEIEKEFNAIDSTQASSKFFGFIVSLLCNLMISTIPAFASYAGSLGVSKGAAKLSRDVGNGAGKASGLLSKFDKESGKEVRNRVTIGDDAGDFGKSVNQKITGRLNKVYDKGRSTADKIDKFNTPLNKKPINIKLPKGKSKEVNISKGATIAASVVGTIDVIRRTVKDWKQMKKDATNNVNADGNLLRAKIQKMFNELKKQIAVLDRYIDANASIKPYDEL